MAIVTFKKEIWNGLINYIKNNECNKGDEGSGDYKITAFINGRDIKFTVNFSMLLNYNKCISF